MGTSLKKVSSVQAGEAALNGVWRELGDLPEGAFVCEAALCLFFDRHPASIKRAVERGELPPSTRLLGKPVWTAGAIIRHVEGRLEAERKEKERAKTRIDKLSA